jgi:hypothetical protein
MNLKNLMITSLIIAFSTAQASDNAHFSVAQDKLSHFMAKPKIQEMFENPQTKSVILEGRASLKATCFKEEVDKSKCECFVKEVDLVSDTAFFYESVKAYDRFLEKVEAKKAGDEKLYQALQEKEDEREGLSSFINKKCGIIDKTKKP